MQIINHLIHLLFDQIEIAPFVIVLFGGLMFWAGTQEKQKNERVEL